MSEMEYDQLFRLLCKLQMESPCHNKACPGRGSCDMRISGAYGDECAIDTVRDEAERRYNIQKRNNERK